ncbi:hypothetical protein MBLNU457_7690t1 [Dothideomycetes sp. NU457]
MASTDFQTAQINRSIRAIKAELEFLTDAAVISPQTLSHLLSQIPAQTALHAPISVGAVPTAAPMAGAPEPPRSPMANLSMNEKNNNNWSEKQNQNSWSQSSQAMPPPPAYGASSAPPALAHATALYAYRGEDAGDLELQAGDKIAVTEYMNAEWWKGVSSRSGAEGIFPRSYVRVEEEKAPMQQQQQQSGMGYGNAPLETSGMGSGTGNVPGKGQEMGKKFGKKLGNAAIFGAGASIGANIVNGIM